MRRPFFSFLAATAILALLVVTPLEGTKKPLIVVVVPQEISFSDDSGASQKVKDECKLQTRLQTFIQSFARKWAKVEITSDPIEEAEGRVLTMEIIHVLGGSGGAWTGTKSMTVKGELRENGEVIGSFLAARYSGGGAFGGYKGTCSILGRCVQVLGKDIAGWLRNPTMDAKLGDA